MFSMDNYYQDQSIRCVKCLEYGHYNCDVVVGDREQSGGYKRFFPFTSHYGGDDYSGGNRRGVNIGGGGGYKKFKN